MVSAVEAFNSPHDEGRVTRVLLILQHAFEMLLKAALVQTGDRRIFDSVTGRSISFEKAVRYCSENSVVKLSDADAGTLRAIDAMRDDEQHWFNYVDEQILFLHARAGITLFDELLERVFEERLSARLPHRVLPLSVDPPRDVVLVLDEEFSQVQSLLQPGRRAGHEARARIRTLLAMEAHVEPESRVSEKDVNRVERQVREGGSRKNVFPRLEEIATSVEGEGLQVKVHFTKRQGAPVRYISDENIAAAGIREVDLLNKYHRPPKELAESLNISATRSTALRRHLGLDVDGAYSHEFRLGSVKQRRYSDNAFKEMKEVLAREDLESIYRAHAPHLGPSSYASCGAPSCRASELKE